MTRHEKIVLLTNAVGNILKARQAQAILSSHETLTVTMVIHIFKGYKIKANTWYSTDENFR